MGLEEIFFSYVFLLCTIQKTIDKLSAISRGMCGCTFKRRPLAVRRAAAKLDHFLFR